MPALPHETIQSLQSVLEGLLAQRKAYSNLEFIDAGGSAAIFKCIGPDGPRAFKVFDPKFLASEKSASEVRRLELQKTLINHGCPYLVQTYSVEITENTAIVEMEFIPWPQLKKKLVDFPDERIPRIISQLIEAVKFLESKGIVHRDIKPENIHIAPDYSSLKLLDLGVAREFDSDPDGAITDHNGTRPFVATAQYSSPEYLFRLDAPSKELWKALNIYQVGAVLHDLIMKKELYSDEVKLDNRWLIARAVLSKTPNLDDGNPTRLSRYKALASRCLSKNLTTRLQTVCWDDFNIGTNNDPLEALSEFIQKSKQKKSETQLEDTLARLEWLRAQHWVKLATSVRTSIQNICKADYPSHVVIPSSATTPTKFLFTISNKPNKQLWLTIIIDINWQDPPQELIADILARAALSATENDPFINSIENESVCSTALECDMSVDSRNISQHIAILLQQAIAISETIDTLDETIKISAVNAKECV